VEYALILAFISVVAISVLVALGNQVTKVFSTISSQMSGTTH
jgi:Flp pilus assembly pilin Flp